MHLSQDTYTTSVGMTYDQDSQDLFLLPAGMTFTVELKVGSWNVKPMAELGVVINIGDKDTKETISYTPTGENATTAQDVVSYTVVNGTSLIGKLGIQAEKGNLTFGVSYQYQKSGDTSDNRFNVNVRYRF